MQKRKYKSAKLLFGESNAGFVALLQHCFKASLVEAYGKLMDAELRVLGSPVDWGLQEKMLDDTWTTKSIVELIKEKGNSIY